jgi:hypothetical protein
MEYHVQRYGSEALFAYSCMGAALAVVLLLTMTNRILAIRMEKQRRQWLFGMPDAEGDVQNA